MASVTMAASFIAGAALSGGTPAAAQRRLVITNNAKATGSGGEKMKVSQESKSEANSGRRDLVFAAAAAAVCSVAGVAMAGEPKPGTPEARKIYAPICVTMPTAKICHK
ncbi:photosystem II 5 kDa protein, chloroplastic-like [Diospyros lotus]|uniref:photosystem II 5 kDa protein, chloroplastic-like n=1 Tax=Diospyros lotus TaxID=55363 RepID=UPI0022529963|nr:photosystem II 5 kDa protein, chloroplastic-like [Diospyros lotus]